MRLLLIFWLACCVSMAAAQTEPAKFTREQWQADVDVLQRAYETLHPGLLRYNTPAEMAKNFAALRSALNADRTLAEGYMALSQFAATVSCGHTYANFTNQAMAIRLALLENTNRVPFYFRWAGDRMIVTRDFTAAGLLPRGTEVRTINGAAVGDILRAMMTIARADGHNDAKRRAQLEVQGTERYETFDVFLPLFYPNTGNKFRLAIQTPGAAQREIEVPALSYAERLATRPAAVDNERGGWVLDTANPRVAWLTMPNWALYRSKWDWKAFLQQSFEQLVARNTPALVIDLRGNEGGLDIGTEILPHLTEQALPAYAPARRVRYRKVPDDLLPYLDTWDSSFKDWGEAVKPFDARFFDLDRTGGKAGEPIVAPRAPRYTGKVYVLIGATNSSATFQFAEQVQRTRLATLVGQTTGGNRRGINGGAFFFLSLPNSRIELDVPLIGTFPSGEPADAGIVPDVQVDITAEAIAAGRDVEREAVMALLPKAAPAK